jgi:hypothetical protein
MDYQQQLESGATEIFIENEQDALILKEDLDLDMEYCGTYGNVPKSNYFKAPYKGVMVYFYVI